MGVCYRCKQGCIFQLHVVSAQVYFSKQESSISFHTSKAQREDILYHALTRQLQGKISVGVISNPLPTLSVVTLLEDSVHCSIIYDYDSKFAMMKNFLAKYHSSFVTSLQRNVYHNRDCINVTFEELHFSSLQKGVSPG